MIYKPLPIGVENFEKMIKSGYYYVDKTLFIKELIDKKSEINLFTRPRRFGKSLSLSMIKYFFEKSEKDTRCLFDGLNIMSQGDKYTSEMNKYPVISITLKDIETPKYEQSFRMLREELIRQFEKHSYLLKSDKISDRQKMIYKDILYATSADESYPGSLRFLSECLELHHSEKVIIMIDEYDVPLERTYWGGYYNEMVDIIRKLFHTTLKTNDSLYFAVITGCLRVSKESIFTGFNNPKIITVISDAYGEYFGFTEEEVTKAFEFYRLGHKLSEARAWYNGYIFGKTNVYNPWSILNFLFDSYDNEPWFPRPYWVNTSSNNIIREFIEIADSDTRDEIEALIRGESITKPIHEDVVYSEIKKEMDNLWNFLFFTGYLKKAGEYLDEDQVYFNLVIPNIEVLTIYKRKIREWFEDNIKTADLNKMYNAILDSNAQVFEEELSEVLADSISYFDSHENFYHGFLAGTLTRMKGYKVKSNRESGNGRADIFLLPVSMKKTAVIFEIKPAKAFTDLEKKCIEALKQIDEKKYAQELRQEGYSNVLTYGVAFYRKDCMVRC